MKIFPAIDLYQGKAVRLFKGDYNEMSVYNDDPVSVAKDFEKAGAKYVHLVDLEGAKFDSTPNFSVVERIAKETDLFVEIGGGIRSMERMEQYLSCGVDRVILGTAAVTDEEFLKNAIKKYGDKIAVGADVKDGFVAIKGWLEKSAYDVDTFFEKMQSIGVKTIICTDVSKDGAMKGTNRELYKKLVGRYAVNVVASGGVSSMDDVYALKEIGVDGAIIGKAYYTGKINLSEAVKAAK